MDIISGVTQRPQAFGGLSRRSGAVCRGLLFAWLLLFAIPAHASIFKGETLDKVANGISWAVLVIAPVVGIAIFWMVHILPEKIAEKRKHPQAKAIQTLCLLSLVFGGLLWPLAWLWAYTKPVLHRLAYGTDIAEHEPAETAMVEGDAMELQRLRARIAELEAKVVNTSNREGGHV